MEINFSTLQTLCNRTLPRCQGGKDENGIGAHLQYKSLLIITINSLLTLILCYGVMCDAWCDPISIHWRNEFCGRTRSSISATKLCAHHKTYVVLLCVRKVKKEKSQTRSVNTISFRCKYQCHTNATANKLNESSKRVNLVIWQKERWEKKRAKGAHVFV